MISILAHADEEVIVGKGLLGALTHQPVWASLLIIAFVLFGIYALLEKLGMKPLNRVIVMVPLLILTAIVYMEHNPTVSTVVLAVGFVTSFVLAFTMMSSKQPRRSPGDVGAPAKASEKDQKENGKPDERA